MKITKERIASIIILFLKERRNFSYYALADKAGVDQKSIKDWEMRERKSIRSSSFDNLVSNLQNEISLAFKEFSEFVITELDNDGISKEYTWKIFDGTRDISNIVRQLLELDISEKKLCRKR